jgi:hypothetical protein
MPLTARLIPLCATALIALGVAGCGSDPEPSAGSSSAPAPASSSSAAGSDATDSAGAAPTTATTVSANTASEEEIAAALDDAGVSNADRWAAEVVEYRPYPTDDPDLTKLRDNLAKYNPGEETTDKIVSALTP